MRNSDEIKNNPFAKSHDSQIGHGLHDEIMLWLYNKLETRFDLAETITGVHRGRIVEVCRKIEHPVSVWRNGVQSTLGFVDLFVGAGYKHFYTKSDFEWCAHDKELFNKMKEEKFELKYEWGNVEIKSGVNIGETIRQIKYYSQGQDKTRWTVCAPPFAQSKVLNEQGINFIGYDLESFI